MSRKTITVHVHDHTVDPCTSRDHNVRRKFTLLEFLSESYPHFDDASHTASLSTYIRGLQFVFRYGADAVPGRPDYFEADPDLQLCHGDVLFLAPKLG